MKVIAMIPARLGSQRLKQKNLQPLLGRPLISHAIQKAQNSGVFDEVWVNSEADLIGEVAVEYGAGFHKRPAELANNQATSEDFVYEFIKSHPCDYLVQVHSIAPLLTQEEVTGFVKYFTENDYDVLLSGVKEQIECMKGLEPVNFTFGQKTNSQDLDPIQRVTWSITGWKSKNYIEAYEAKKCATYEGKVGFYGLNRMAGHIIKTEEDLIIAERFLS